jgi:hypothetical protein
MTDTPIYPNDNSQSNQTINTYVEPIQPQSQPQETQQNNVELIQDSDIAVQTNTEVVDQTAKEPIIINGLKLSNKALQTFASEYLKENNFVE